MNVSLEIPEYASEALRARLSYAFRLFCAIYGHRPIVGADLSQRGEVTIRYRDAAAKASIADVRTVWLCRGLQERDYRRPAPPPLRYSRNGVNTVLHYEPERGKAPDWLGEIFEWVSCADEHSVTARDRIGRAAFAFTYAGRHGLDPRIPYAALAMRALQLEICRVAPRANEHPVPPQGLGGHAVIPTHDVDYFHAGRMRAAWRLARNAAISCLMGKRPALGMRQCAYALQVLLGCKQDPLDSIALLIEKELSLGISSSFYFLVRSAHRLDAGYELSSKGVADILRWLHAQNMEIGLHGSFTSLDESGLLRQERSELEACGVDAVGGRQHWLRFTLDRLIEEVEQAGLQYDASIGWSTRIGFRSGACFAYPPYDFVHERPANFLEFPLIAMDQALNAFPGGEEPLFHEVARMIGSSRHLGWGGISILWHPAAFGDGWLPKEVGEIFWRLAENRRCWGDTWISASRFLEIARDRYAEAGLLSAAAPVLANKTHLLPDCARRFGATSNEPLRDSGAALSA